MSEKIVCLCNKISEDTIISAIKNGADTVEKVKEVTNAAGGFCKGARCKETIQNLINENK